MDHTLGADIDITRYIAYDLSQLKNTDHIIKSLLNMEPMLDYNWVQQQLLDIANHNFKPSYLRIHKLIPFLENYYNDYYIEDSYIYYGPKPWLTFNGI